VAPGVVAPKLAGHWKWGNPRTLTFTPESPLPKASAFKLTLLPERLHSPDGLGLAKAFVSTVTTQRLEVLSVHQAELDKRDRVVVEIEFSDEVIPAEVLAHLTLTTQDGKPIGAVVHGEAVGRTARFLTDSLPTAKADTVKAYLQVRVSPGLVGRSGPLGLADAYQCNLPIGSELIATGANSYFSDHSNASLTLQFNNPVDLNALKPLLSVSPAVPFTLSQRYDGVTLNGAFQPATRYSIQIAKAPAGVAPSACPRPDTLSVFVPDVSPSYWFEHEEGYLGSGGNRALMAHAVNTTSLRALAYRIYDNNLVSWRNNPGRYSKWAEGYSRPIASKVFELLRRKNITQDLRISMDELLPADAPRDGVYLIALEPARPQASDNSDDDEEYHGRAVAVVTLSDIGLTAKRTRSGVTAWATSLRTATPVAGVRMRLFSNKNQFLGEAVTGDDGLATVKLGTAVEGEEPRVILADQPDQAGSDGKEAAARELTWLDLNNSRLTYGDADTGGAPYLRSGFEAFAYTDRGVYRPGETVHLRAIVRGVDGATPGRFPVSWRFQRPDLHDWKNYPGTIDADGAVSMDLQLPDDLPTGHWTATLGLPSGSTDRKPFGEVSFQVEEFMPARMQVGLKLNGSAPAMSQRLTMNDTTNTALAVQADYLFGKPVAGRPARVVARIDPEIFAPKQWDGWSFGDSAQTATLDGQKAIGHRLELPEETLDDRGAAKFSIGLADLLQSNSDDQSDPVQIPKPRAGKRKLRSSNLAVPKEGNKSSFAGPWRMTLTASVIETSGRAVTTTAQGHVDVVPAYIGIRRRGANGPSDAQSQFDVAMVTPDGNNFPSDATLTGTLYREDWNNSLTFEKGRYVYHSVRLLEPVAQNLNLTIHGEKSVLTIPSPGAGAYVLKLNDRKSSAMTSFSFFAGDGAWDDNVSRENPERLELIVQKTSTRGEVVRSLRAFDLRGTINALRSAFNPETSRFRPGDSAQVIVRSPFAGRLLLTVETDDVITRRVIEMSASQIAVPLDISSACRPNAYVSATVVRAVDPNAQWRTHRAFGVARVAIDNDDRKLNIQIDSPKAIRPTTSLGAQIHVTDASGAPVANAAVTVAAVDEGICALTGFKTPDPSAFFARDRALGVELADLFGQLMPEVAKPDKVSAIGGDKDAYDPRHASPVSARRVKPVALMSAVLHTDETGIARAEFNVPQFTGALRLMAVGSSVAASGSGTAQTLVRSPLLVQSSWPRFAAPGDTFRVPLVVFNNSDLGGKAVISLHVDQGAIRFANGRDIELPTVELKPNGQISRLIDVTAQPEIGVSRITLTARLGDETYSEVVELPIRPPSPEITVGGYAIATPEKIIDISLPDGMLKGTERSRIKVTPFPTLELPQGLDYLEHYPYGCLEQTTSALFPLVYLGDIGQQIAPGVFEPERIATKVEAGMTRLIGMQTANGGLSMWPGYRDAWPWGSVYAAHFVVEAENAGFSAPPEFRKQLLAYVRNTLNQSSDNPEVLDVQAYACYVLALAGAPERAVMNRLNAVLRGANASADEARFHLSSAWLASGRRDLAEGLLPQALPKFGEARLLTGSLGSPVRERAVLVNTLLAAQPDHPALPALVQQLADSGPRHEWRSTQDTAFAVLALGKYLRQARTTKTYGSIELLGDGQTLSSATGPAALDWDATHSSANLSLRVTGEPNSKAYVSWLTTGVPLVPPKPADHGMNVRRRLLNEEGKPLAPGAPIRSGDLIQIELSISSPTALSNVVIEDLLPAGFEIENPRLITSVPGVDQKDEAGANAFRDARLEMHDDRLVVMGDLTRPGSGTYIYAARAVTPGSFVLPPVRGECMYDIGINSISESARIEVLHVSSTGLANVEQGN